MRQPTTDSYREVEYGTAEYDLTMALRDEVLRKPLGLEFSPDELALEERSFHLAYWRGDELAACLVLTPLSAKQVRMRQLAVQSDMHGQGIGRSLVTHSEAFARDHGFEEMVLHARSKAVAFYEKLGYEVHGSPFIEVTIPHFSMRKTLVNGGGQTCPTACR